MRSAASTTKVLKLHLRSSAAFLIRSIVVFVPNRILISGRFMGHMMIPPWLFVKNYFVPVFTTLERSSKIVASICCVSA